MDSSIKAASIEVRRTSNRRNLDGHFRRRLSSSWFFAFVLFSVNMAMYEEKKESVKISENEIPYLSKIPLDDG